MISVGSGSNGLAPPLRIGEICAMSHEQTDLPDLPDLPGFHEHLERCLRLAEQALEAGNSAFGSVLVDGVALVDTEHGVFVPRHRWIVPEPGR